MDIFERAARAQLRFPTSGGDYTTEDLFDLPLTHATKINLDSLARGVSRELKAFEEDSFVEAKPNERKIQLQLKLDILKHVIASKQSDIAAAETRAKNAESRRRLTEVLNAKQDEELKSMSKEDIIKKLGELGD